MSTHVYAGYAQGNLLMVSLQDVLLGNLLPYKGCWDIGFQIRVVGVLASD